MATIDELVVRLDADLRPLEAKLNRATKLLKDFEAQASRSLGRASAGMGTRVPGFFTGGQMARLGFRPRPGGPERSGAAEARAPQVRAGAGAAVTEVSTTRPAVGAGPILIEIGISVAGSLLADAVKDALQTRDLDIPGQVLENVDQATFDPSAAGDIAVEFAMAAEELRKAAEESSVAFQRFANLQFSEEADQIASAIGEKLEEQLALRAAALQDAISGTLAAQEAAGVTTPENTAQVDLIAQRLSQDLGSLQGGQAIDLERFSLQFAELLALVDESLRDPVQQLGKQVQDFAAAVERIERDELTPEGQERRERALSDSERTQTLQLELPEGLGNACDCIEDLLGPFLREREIDRGGGDIQEASLNFAGETGTAGTDDFAADLKVVKDLALQWGAVRDRAGEVKPVIADTRRETIELNRVARDLGFTFSSALEDAIVDGEKFSDILQGLERDILRILTRTLITEPIAEGIRGGIQGEETSAGGLEGLLNKAFGTSGLLFGEDEPEAPTITRVDSEIADACGVRESSSSNSRLVAYTVKQCLEQRWNKCIVVA